MHGQFSWYDLMTPDAGPATKFYPAVTGWGTEEWDQAKYTMWTVGDRAFAGINPISPEQTAQGVRPHWLAYVTVDDVDRTVSKTRAAGGRVLHGPEAIPSVGRFAILQDPQGGIVAVIKSDTPTPGFDGTPTLGRFSWHELMTTDYRAAFEFYRQLFGWEKTGEMDMGPDGMYLMYGMKGKPFGGIFNRRAEHGNMPPNWTFYVNVKDVGRAIDAIKRNGGEMAMGPMQVPGGDTIAIAKDPQGAMFAVHQVAPKTAATAPRPKARPKARPKKKAKTARKAKKSSRSAARRAGAKKAARKKPAKRAKATARRSAARRPKAAKKKGRRR